MLELADLKRFFCRTALSKRSFEPSADSGTDLLTSAMLTFRTSTDQDLPRVMQIWRRAVDATHHFLSPVDKSAIKAELLKLFPQVSLQLVVDASGTPQGFMFLHDGHLEALFIHPDQDGTGIGKAFIHRAVAAHPDLTTDVNEQNPEALGFYEHVGIVRTGTSSHDGQGRPYPFIIMLKNSDDLSRQGKIGETVPVWRARLPKVCDFATLGR